MNWTLILDIAGAIAILFGSFLALMGAVGLYRFPDIYARMHAATKPQTLGLLMILTGLALTLRSWSAVGTLIIVAISQALTAPVSAHMLGRTAYRSNIQPRDTFSVDELGTALNQAETPQPSEPGVQRADEAPPRP